MDTKALILVLLGSTLVLANPVSQVDSANETEQSLKNKVIGWLNKVEDEVMEYYQQGKKTFEEAFEEVKHQGEHAVEISKEKYNELKEKYEEIKENAKIAYAEKKKILDAEIEEIKHKGVDAIASGKVKFQELKQKAMVVLAEEEAKLQAKLNQWKETAKKYLEAAKDKFNHHVE